ncbi:MAG: hypothetical protein QNI96_05120 [Woeseiaceae bacterium]|nr:hypothetical protein [Woeseiaceae bacterium]
MSTITGTAKITFERQDSEHVPFHIDVEEDTYDWPGDSEWWLLETATLPLPNGVSTDMEVGDRLTVVVDYRFDYFSSDYYAGIDGDVELTYLRQVIA